MDQTIIKKHSWNRRGPKDTKGKRASDGRCRPGRRDCARFLASLGMTWRNFVTMNSRCAVLFCVVALCAPAVRAWDYPGHRIVNQVALASLPADFPAFVREPDNVERIAWLCSEPDRWRSTPDLPAQHFNAIDHYLDIEQLADAGLDPAKVSAFRYEFAVQFAAGRAAHPENFPPIDPEKNSDHTREWCGFLPWTIIEYFGKLRADFARLKVLEGEQLGSPEEIAQTKRSICELMGMMGHFVGDGAQPLHTTRHHDGWVGPNPQGYTEKKGIHSWIDGGFIAKAHVTFDDLRPLIVPAESFVLPPVSKPPAGAPAPATPVASVPAGRDKMFGIVMDYLLAQHTLVELLYQLDKEGKFRIENNGPPTPEGRAFIEKQLLVGGEMLGRIWLTAWRTAEPDNYLHTQLSKKKVGVAPQPGN
jgi:hypothetical protein